MNQFRGDLRLEIRNQLLGGELYVNQLHRRLGANKTRYTEILKKMVESGEIKVSKNKNRKILSLVDPLDKISKLLHEFNFKQVENNANILLKKLQKDGSLFVVTGKVKAPLPDPKNKNKIKWKTFPTWGMNLKSKSNFHQLIYLINSIFSHSAALTYAEALELVSKSDIDSIKTHQKNYIKLIQKIIKQLIYQNKKKESKIFIKHHLKFKVLGYGQLQQIGTL